MYLPACYHYFTYALQSESILYTCINVKEPISGNRCVILSLSDKNEIWNSIHLVRKWTLNHLDRLDKYWAVLYGTFLYCVFDCMLLSCHVSVSEWICTLCLPECQGTIFSKPGQYEKFKWHQQGYNAQPCIIKQILNHLARLARWLSFIFSTYLYGAFDCILLSCDVRFPEWIYTIFVWMSECLSELLAQNRRDILSLSKRNDMRKHNHIVLKKTFNHLDRLTKWLSCVVSTFLFGAFDCMLLSCHVRVSDWNYTI